VVATSGKRKVGGSTPPLPTPSKLSKEAPDQRSHPGQQRDGAGPDALVVVVYDLDLDELFDALRTL
jgi:hypothetical protein